jgi:hypothetical protein
MLGVSSQSLLGVVGREDSQPPLTLERKNIIIETVYFQNDEAIMEKASLGFTLCLECRIKCLGFMD